MALRLTIMTQHARSLGERATKEFGHNGGTIGRSLDCDWPLPDGQRFLSSRHASIDYRSGSYYVIDTSTNGVFVNGANQAVGRGKPQRLFSGDRIRIGDYEIGVEIDGGEETSALTEEHHVDPVDLAQRVEAPPRTAEVLVDEMEITGIGIEELLTEDEAATLTPPSLFDGFELEIVQDPPRVVAESPRFAMNDQVPETAPASAQTGAIRKPPAPENRAAPARPAALFAPAAPASSTERAATSTERPATSAERPGSKASFDPQRVPAPHAAQLPAAARSSSQPAAQSAAGPAAPGPAQSAPNRQTPRPTPRPPALAPLRGGKPTAALDAFFRGAGLTGARVDAQQAEAILLRLGQLMREMILGISESLHLRAEQKNALRLPNTTIQQQNNNPLKFSASVEETLMNLLFRDSQEYMTATEAVREAYADLRLHQLSLLKALRGALDVYTQRLDPDELEHKFSRGKSGMLMGAANKLKYWDLYKDVFQLVADHPPGEFPAQFLDDFAEAYEDEIARAIPGEDQSKAQAG